MTAAETEAVALVRAYLDALEQGATGDALARFFTPDAVQTEWPNRLNPAGGTSDLPTLLARAARGRALLAGQRYHVRTAVACGADVAVEADWEGTLAVPLGALEAGATMRAHFAMFFTLRAGRIAAQRNFDCFEPW